MNLNDLQNDTLFNLQASELVNFGGTPLYAGTSNPTITQAGLIFQINRAYTRALADLADIELTLYSLVFQSVANVSDYPLPPNAPIAGAWGTGKWGSMVWGGNAPNMQRLSRVFYNPVGQPWTQEFEGGVRLISWAEFQRQCAFGYLRPFTYNIIPDYCSVSPDRTKISFFPGSSSSGDVITLQYVPELTPNTAFAPLVNGTDIPSALPDPAHDLIVYWATALCWMKLREVKAMMEWRQMYDQEKMRIRAVLTDRSRGDTQRIRTTDEGLALSYPLGGSLSLP